MAQERTLSIVKPDGVGRNLIGQVYSRLEKAGLRIIAARMLHLSQREAEGFYAVHRERPFFKDLVKYMTSGPVVVQVLEGEDAIAQDIARSWARPTRRRPPGHHPRRPRSEHRENVVHGSDAPDTAAGEIAYFFRTTESAPRAADSRTESTAVTSPVTTPHQSARACRAPSSRRSWRIWAASPSAPAS